MDLRTVEVFALALAFACASMAFLAWVHADASRRGVAPWKVMLLLVCCPVLGLIAWLLLRPGLRPAAHRTY